MATANIRSRGAGLAITMRLEGLERTDRAFKDVRNRASRDLRTLEQQAADQEIIPAARARAGNLAVAGQPVGATLVVRKALSGVYLTTSMRGIRGRAVGLQEFGGTIKAPIVPKHRKALLINGELRSIVRKARHYRARKFMFGAVDQRLKAFGETVRDKIVDFFTDPPFDR